jgi:hypothetical protein
LLREQPLETRVRGQRDDFKFDQPLPHQWQSVQRCLGFRNVFAFHHQHSFLPVGPEINFAQYVCLVQIPDLGCLGAQKRLDALCCCLFRFFLKSKYFQLDILSKARIRDWIDSILFVIC